MSDTGWIKLHRQLQDSPLWHSEPFSKAQAWIDLIMSMNHKDEKVLFDNQLIEVKRGQHITSYRKLSVNWKWSIGKVKRFFELLANDNMVKVEHFKNGTLLTLVNYELYQGERNTDGTPIDTPTNTPIDTQTEQTRNTDGTLTETNKNDKNEKNEKNDKNEKNNIPPIIPHGKNEKKKKKEIPFSENKLVQEAFNDFYEMRIKIKHPLTDKAVEMLKTKLNGMTKDPVTQAKILDQSTFKSWQGVFEIGKDFTPLRDYKTENNMPESQTDDDKEMTDEEWLEYMRNLDESEN